MSRNWCSGDVFTVILGAHRIREHEPSQQRFTVKKADGVVVHPGWNAVETVNDIALIPLPSDAVLNGTGHAARGRWRALPPTDQRMWICPQSTSS